VESSRLEQRIARAWRKNQTKPVTVINLVSDKTIEQRMFETLAGKQALADGVLDLRGDLNAIPLRGGKQAFLAKLQQLLMPRQTAAGSPPGHLSREQIRKISTDRCLAFAERARETINGSLIRCEERYPNEGAHSVLFIVVDESPARHQSRLEGVHAELFGPGRSDPLAPVHLEVIDRATDETLRRLMKAGLIQPTTRSCRHLFPVTESISEPTPLNSEERARADAFRAQAARKIKMAELLAGGGLSDEARSPVIDAILGVGRALAVEARLPEPTDLNGALLGPLSHSWGDALMAARGFMADAAAPCQPAITALKSITA
jgi:hypothetical protein